MVKGPSVEKRILSSAARLFAKNGVGATSIRAITFDAQANLNSVHYHFGSRKGLLAAVWDRAIGPIQKERERSFTRLPERAGTEEILESLYGPILRRGRLNPNSDGARSLLVANQIRQDPSEDARAILALHEDSVIARHGDALQGSLQCNHKLGHALIFINAAAWDAATQALLSRIEGEDIDLDVGVFLDLMTTGLRGLVSN